jgi:hypothetical protein
VLKVDGFDKAIIGEVISFNRPNVLCYSIGGIIDIMVKRDGMTVDEAYEFFDYNIAGAYHGDGTPVFLADLEWSDV